VTIPPNALYQMLIFKEDPEVSLEERGPYFVRLDVLGGRRFWGRATGVNGLLGMIRLPGDWWGQL
jgi:hypothetical protein